MCGPCCVRPLELMTVFAQGFIVSPAKKRVNNRLLELTSSIFHIVRGWESVGRESQWVIAKPPADPWTGYHLSVYSKHRWVITEGSLGSHRQEAQNNNIYSWTHTNTINTLLTEGEENTHSSARPEQISALIKLQPPEAWQIKYQPGKSLFNVPLMMALCSSEDLCRRVCVGAWAEDRPRAAAAR